ncbi:hypothetical protein ACQKEU_22970, partial [Acidovorax sp. NPDC077664]
GARTAQHSHRTPPLPGPLPEGKMKTYYGVVATYDKPFSLQDKDAITRNMLVIGMVKNGAITFAYPEDAKRNLIIQRKQ